MPRVPYVERFAAYPYLSHSLWSPFLYPKAIINDYVGLYLYGLYIFDF